jgi:hypothetical protein
MNRHDPLAARPLHSGKRQYDHADIDGQPVESNRGQKSPTMPRSPPDEEGPDAIHPPTEDDRDLELPDRGPSHYGEDVERDSDA